ncbi:MAG: hypothetical protein ACO2ZL_06650 [Flavobacteriales bacterium]
MMKKMLTLFFAGLTVAASAQIVPMIELQGESDVSPYAGQTVTVSGKVTEYFGDSWYMQDGFGSWNGVYIEGPTVAIPANPPYWSADRQPEVGDVLEISGTVAEVDGNTQIIDATLVDFVDFWNATPMGIWVTAAELQDEQYEGTRVRVDNATVLTAPDAEGYWTVGLEDGEVTCWGVDTYDPSGNEDPDGPTPGDVYQIYGASHQNGDAFVLHVGDIDVLSLDVQENEMARVRLYPNPAHSMLRFACSSSRVEGNVVFISLFDARGSMLERRPWVDVRYGWDITELPGGLYHAHFEVSGGVRSEVFSVPFVKLD